jgi:hypothetical protein
MTTTTTKGYGLQHNVTGQLACLDTQQTDGDGDHYVLTLQKSEFHGGPFPVFEVDTPEKAALARAVNTPFYDSTAVRPGWGTLDLAEYRVVEIVRVCSMEVAPADVPDTVRFDPPVLKERAPHAAAVAYLGRTIPEPFDEQSKGFVLVRMPAGESVESLRAKCELRPVIFGQRTERPERCLGVFDVPAEHAHLFENGAGVGLITTYFDF